MALGTVTVECGRLAGVTTADGALSSFKGIPYAQPPIGDLRWRPPAPVQAWEGVRPADSFAPHAIQPPVADYITGGGYGRTSEDCLYLNVWTGAEEPDDRRPVMVWFHHGGYFYGGTGVPFVDGGNLARAGAVLVTVNHRLGRLAFLAHPELTAESPHGASGNYGLMDQIEALRWVQRNIAAFGGDPDRVTVFGLSAGSMTTNLLMASPLARGLFQRAIGQSGALMAPPAHYTGQSDVLADLRSAEEIGRGLARSLGLASLDELRRAPAQDLVMARIPFGEPPSAPSPWLYGGAPFDQSGFMGTYPVIDGYVLPRTPFEIFAAGEQADVPLITGNVRHESRTLPWIPELAAWTEDAHAQYGSHADRFLEAFPATESDVGEVSATSYGDRVFTWQNWTWARTHVRTATGPCFLYHWSHEPPARDVEPEFADIIRGAFHGAELPYVFRNLEARRWPWSAFDHELMEAITSYWLQFARTGDPNGDGLPRWPRFDPDQAQVMRFGEDIAAGPMPRRDPLDFWDDWYGFADGMRGAQPPPS